MIRPYERLTRQCATVNQLNRVHIALENQLLPAGLHALVQSASSAPVWRDRWSAERQRWIAGLHHWFSCSGIAEPQAFRRRCIARGIVLYADGRIPVAEKRLLVCFTGVARRLMIPMPVFLQHVDARSTDVLLLRYPKPEGYRSGMPGIAASFSELFSVLPDFFPSGAYRQRAALGVSGGAIPAVVLGILAGFDAAMAFGIGHPEDTRWREVLSGSVSTTVSALRSRHAHTRIALVHGKDSESDRVAAETWATALPARIFAIGQQDAKVGHACMHPFVMAGQLTSFLERELWTHP